MVEVVSVTRLDELNTRRVDAALPAFDVTQCSRHGCDAHVIVSRASTIVARASLWWSETPAMPDHRLGTIGHYAAIDAAGGLELLNGCCAELRAHNCTLAVGPMDGSTWRRYRFITERGTEPPFFLEANNPDDWPAHWTQDGFTSLATYFSALNSDLNYENPQVTRAGARLLERGICVRKLDPLRFADELRLIYAVSVRSFTDNFLYTPISEAEFLAQYSAIHQRVRPELVLIAEHEREPVGYLFALPDWLEACRGNVNTVILKTVAVLPERRCAGLGVWLVQEAQRAARELGYRRAIHALMHESNNSLNLSARYAKPFRRYTLFSRPL